MTDIIEDSPAALPGDSLTDTIRSLTALMREETLLLGQFGGRRDIEDLAAAKLRLTAALETELAARGRDRPDWQAELSAEARAALAEAVDDMQRASAANADVLLRQIELSRDMLDAIAAEAKRLSGTRSQTYRATGGLIQVDLPAPIAVNTSL